MNKKDRALEVATRLKIYHPNPETELIYQNEMQLVISVVLSAQTTDKKVNEVTKELFSKYKVWEDFAVAKVADLETALYGVNFQKTKATRVKGLASGILNKFNGKVPKKTADLVSLPGIARKSANVILQELWDIAEGVVVDTHVTRVSNLLGLAEGKDAEKIEKQLMDLIPRDFWRNFSGAMVLHGRYVCIARRPKCEECFLNDVCPSSTF